MKTKSKNYSTNKVRIIAENIAFVLPKLLLMVDLIQLKFKLTTRHRDDIKSMPVHMTDDRIDKN